MAEEPKLLAEPPGPVSSDLVLESRNGKKEAAVALRKFTFKYGRFWRAGPGRASTQDGRSRAPQSLHWGAD